MTIFPEPFEISLELLAEQELEEENEWSIYKNYAEFDDPDELENW